MNSEHAAVITAYINEVKDKYYTGYAREMAYRPALQALIQGLCPDTEAINDPKRQEVGAPDFIIAEKNHSPQQESMFPSIPLAFVEAKDIGVDLDKKENQEQLTRYLELGNVVHTDSLKFRFYFDKELVKEVVLATRTDSGQGIMVHEAEFETLAHHFRELVAHPGQTIRTAKQLAITMADKAHWIRTEVVAALGSEADENRGEVYAQYVAFKKELIHDLTPESFADIYAQTIAYGLFSARYNDTSPDTFSLSEAAEKLPATNPFLQRFFRQIAGYEREQFLELALNNFARIFQYASVHDIMSNYGRSTAMHHDPVIHFYETFLAEYDPKLRKARGVYYTPLPVVQYIVRAVDDVLKNEFGLAQGLADDSTIDFTYTTQPFREKYGKKDKTEHTRPIPRVQILDPATGTGTFLNEIIKHIYEVKGKNIGTGWNSYVEQNLLPRLHGFELLMAAYAMAHMRLGLTLAETGYTPSINPPRLGVYLTNTLEPPSRETEDNTLLGLLGMARTLSEESHAADSIKRDQPIMVVVGNPPYSVSSSNKNKFIEDLTADYKKDLGERNIQPLSDDYIKFIRYAEHMIEKSGQGIVAMITNNSYFDGLIHRKMREHLLKTFDKVYVLDLHGNSKKKEVALDGGKDENVFDIQQGVGIVIAIKYQTTDKKMGHYVFKKDYLGTRKRKYELLESESLENFEIVALDQQSYSYMLSNQDGAEGYRAGISIFDLFLKKSSGVETRKDSLVISMDRIKLVTVVNNFKIMTEAELMQEYHLTNDSRDWKIDWARKDIMQNNPMINTILYKPFDIRHVIYTGKTKGINGYPMYDNFKHVLEGENYSLCLMRKQINTPNFSSIIMSKVLTDKNLYGFQTYNFPLYRYENDGVIANLADAPLNKLLENLEPYCYVDREEDLPGPQPDIVITAIDVLDYIYAVLHSPNYRETYKEFLKSDFPRVPKPESHEQFSALVELGGKLRQLHLMNEAIIGDAPYSFNGEGDNTVLKPSFTYATASVVTENDATGSVYINDTQYFGNVPELAWNFYIGGYQPAQKWLKDRRGRALTYKDIEHYQKIIKILTETHKIMQYIDQI